VRTAVGRHRAVPLSARSTVRRPRPARIRALVEVAKQGESGLALLVLLGAVIAFLSIVVAVVMTLAFLAYELA